MSARPGCEERLRQAEAAAADAGARLQAAVLIGVDASPSPGLDFAFAALPSSSVAGDFLDIQSLREGSLDLLIGDVMGKGMEAATLGVVLKHAFLRAQARLALRYGDPPRLDELCAEAEASASSHFIARRSIATLAYLRICEREGLFEFVDCGHTGVVHYRAADRCCRLVKGADMPFGFAESQSFRRYLAPYGPGDALLLFSDGLSECEGSGGEPFGEERIMRYLKARGGESARAIVDGLVRVGSDYARGAFQDDLTLACVRAGEQAAASAPERSGRLRLLLEPGSGRPGERLRAAVAAALAADGGVGDDTAAEIVLACHEALENIQRYALTGGGRCMASWRLRGRVFSLELDYRGPDYDWLSVPEADASDFSPRGYGRAIIDKAMDSAFLCAGFGDEKTLVMARRLA